MQARTNRSIGLFPYYPSQLVIDDFFRHLSQTGTPDTWQYHDPSPPPKDEEYEEITSFQIPKKLRANSGMASCPICSPSHPKYYEGVLAWFPSEGVLRAIGHECARSHFGGAIHNAAIARREHRENTKSAQEWLLDNLHLVAQLRSEAERILPTAIDADSARSQLMKASSKEIIQRLSRATRSGVVSIEVAKNSAFMRADERNRKTAGIILYFEISGSAYLGRKTLIQAEARNSIQALTAIETAPHESQALLDFVVSLGEGEHLMTAYRLGRQAFQYMDTLRRSIFESKSFFSEENILKIEEWSSHPEAGFPLKIAIDKFYPRILLKKPSSKGNIVIVPETLRG